MDIVGHEREREVLAKGLEQGSFAQAYLFIGPRSIGKSLCALEYASLLTREPHFSPTPEKPHPYDVMVLRPLTETKRGITKTRSIPAESLREALQFLGQYPAAGGHRVLIIEEAHRLSETAQNALLKTLEEPKSTAVIILVTHEIGALLPTVLSRVKRVAFQLVPEEKIREAAEKIYSAPERAVVAPFFYALGRPGMVWRALRNPDSFVTERELLGSLFRLSTLRTNERLTLAEKLATDTERTIELLEWWLPGLHRQAQKETDVRITKVYFRFLAMGEETVRLMKTTQSNARLLLEKLFLAL
jgi:DNA polymerase III, delta subunit